MRDKRLQTTIHSNSKDQCLVNRPESEVVPELTTSHPMTENRQNYCRSSKTAPDLYTQGIGPYVDSR